MNRINISFDEKHLYNFGMAMHIRHCIKQALRFQGVNTSCEINVLVTDDKGIRTINAANRNIDKSTDILSFPAFDFEPGVLPTSWEPYIDPDTGRVPLGDMCISVEHARAQALEYGHSIKREVGYLIVHSVLHLLGYDHLDEGEMKRQMRQQEEAIMTQLSLKR